MDSNIAGGMRHGTASESFPLRLQTQLARPATALRPFVWCYGQNQGRIADSPIVMPLPARPKHVLTFFLASGPARSLVTGPQTHQRMQVALSGEVDNFTIHFQPSGFHQLFGLPMWEFADAAHDAEGVIGRAVVWLRDALGETANFRDRVRMADSVLLQLAQPPGREDAVATVANHIFATHGNVRVEALAALCDLSPRQFERRFRAYTGLPPKLYARITRFNAALSRKLSDYEIGWAAIAHDCGYADQMHLVRDFREFSGDSPGRFSGRVALAPELHSMFATEDYL